MTKLAAVPDVLLAEELRGRGWKVEPSTAALSLQEAARILPATARQLDREERLPGLVPLPTLARRPECPPQDFVADIEALDRAGRIYLHPHDMPQTMPPDELPYRPRDEWRQVYHWIVLA